jgi:hypothetical protein
MIPGIPDVLFTVSINYDIFALNPKGEVEHRYVKPKNAHFEQYSTVLVYK